ncbi:helix-turn-helix domain-containing protein [bacterium]|nr:helix-turn-helix domain-containing protein [bacterium]
MKNKEVIKSDITFIEACKILGKSERTLSRYIRKGLINPEKVKSDRGTIQYRFNQADLESLKIPGTDKIRQDIRGDTRQAIRQDSEVINILRDQLTIKDKQIKSLSGKIDQLIERSRETNILLRGLANKVLMLEGKTEKAETINEVENKDKDREDRQDKTRQDRGQKIRGFFNRLFKG